jgi:hypothetical protein
MPDSDLFRLYFSHKILVSFGSLAKVTNSDPFREIKVAGVPQSLGTITRFPCFDSFICIEFVDSHHQHRPIFTNRSPLDLPLLTIMGQNQLKGYPALFGVLEFHGDILFSEFVTQSFLQPRRASQLFFGTILANLTKGSFGIFNDISAVEVHIGH